MKRRREPMGTPEYSVFVERIVRRYGRRVGEADPEDLTRLLEVQAAMDAAVVDAVAGLREAGFSWRQIGAALNTSGPAAHMRFASRMSA